MVEQSSRSPRTEETMGAPLEDILVATDGSDGARAAGLAAADMAKRSGARLHVVHVRRAGTPGVYAATMPGVRDAWHEQKAGELISSEVESIETSGAAVEGAHSAKGEVAEKVSALARELRAGLVVVGSRGLGPVARLTDGSVSERVVRFSPCAVLLVRAGTDNWPPARVVAGVDFSNESLAAARTGAALGHLYGAPTLLANAHPTLQVGQKARASGGSRPGFEAENARELLVRTAMKIDDEVGDMPEVKTIIGDPAGSILGAAEGDDQPVLVAVGSRGLGAFGRLASGSVSTAVMRGADGPVLVCR